MAAAELKLYHYWRSSCSWRVRWALALKQISYEAHSVNLLTNEQRSDAYLKINPMGTVPTLLINSVATTESMAILEWIEETYTQSPLLPKDALLRLQVRRFCQMIVSGTQPLQNLAVLKRVSDLPEQRKVWAQYWIGSGLAACETLLQQHAGRYCFADTITMADLCLIPQIYNARRNDVDLSLMPRCQRIYDECMKTPACLSSSPEQQPERPNA